MFQVPLESTCRPPMAACRGGAAGTVALRGNHYHHRTATATATAAASPPRQYLIRFELIHRTLVIPSPPTTATTKEINQYIKRNIIVQIQQLQISTNSRDDHQLLRTLQRHLHSINDLVLTPTLLPFGSVSLHPNRSHIYGGKGGFGTLLKGQSKQSSVTTTKNFTSCRNLQGQRLQHVNDQLHLQLVAEWRQKIQQGLATELDMVKALTNTPSGIPGWHLPLPSWSEVSIKREMKQNQKLLHQYQRNQQTQELNKRHRQEQYQQQMQQAIRTTQSCTEQVERTVTSALQRSLQKQQQQKTKKKQQQQQLQREQENEITNPIHKRPKLDPESTQTTTTTTATTLVPHYTLPLIATISGQATMALVPSSLSSSFNDSTRSNNDHHHHLLPTTHDDPTMVNWNIQGDSNFCTIGVLLQQLSLPKGSQHLYYEVVLVTATGVIQIGWAATTSTTTNATTSPISEQSFQPDSNNGDGVGDCQYSWGYDPTRSIKLHNSVTEPYNEQDTISDDASLVPASIVQPGDVIGCTYDLSNGTICYSHNGRDLDMAFIVPQTDRTNMPLIPAISLNEGEQIELRLHPHQMRYLPKAGMAVGDILQKPPSTSTKEADSDNATDGIMRSIATNDNDNDMDDRKPSAIESTPSEPLNISDTILATDVTSSNGSSVLVAESKDANDQTNLQTDPPIDLQPYTSAVELEGLGLLRLKDELMKVGLKCGGTLQERAARLFAIRDIVDPKDYPSKLLASTKTARTNNKTNT